MTKLIFSLAFVALSSTAFAAPTPAEQTYAQLAGPEFFAEFFQDGGRMLGVVVSQKNYKPGYQLEGGFCRKYTVVYPGAKSRYACFDQILSGEVAREEYERSDLPESDVTFSQGNEPVVGSHWAEKQMDAAHICVKTNPVIPNAASAYRCYENTAAAQR